MNPPSWSGRIRMSYDCVSPHRQKYQYKNDAPFNADLSTGRHISGGALIFIINNSNEEDLPPQLWWYLRCLLQITCWSRPIQWHLQFHCHNFSIVATEPNSNQQYYILIATRICLKMEPAMNKMTAATTLNPNPIKSPHSPNCSLLELSFLMMNIMTMTKKHPEI